MSKITFSKAEGNGREDGYTESAIMLDGVVVGFLTSHYDKTDPCDWYSTRSMRVVSVEAQMHDDDDTVFSVSVYRGSSFRGYRKIPGVTSAGARAEVKRWIKSFLDR